MEIGVVDPLGRVLPLSDAVLAEIERHRDRVVGAGHDRAVGLDRRRRDAASREAVVSVLLIAAVLVAAVGHGHGHLLVAIGVELDWQHVGGGDAGGRLQLLGGDERPAAPIRDRAGSRIERHQRLGVLEHLEGLDAGVGGRQPAEPVDEQGPGDPARVGQVDREQRLARVDKREVALEILVELAI